MVYNVKFIVKGSSRAKIYSVFKYVNFGSLTAPEAFIMLFGNGIPLQRVIPMFYRTIKLKYPSGAKWEPFLHIFAVPLSSRNGKCCQMVERHFFVFHHFVLIKNQAS